MVSSWIEEESLILANSGKSLEIDESQGVRKLYERALVGKGVEGQWFFELTGGSVRPVYI